MSQLKVEAEYGYGGEIHYQIIEFDDEHEEEVVATVYGRPDIAEALVDAVNALSALEPL
jgi:hypothetical protein